MQTWLTLHLLLLIIISLFAALFYRWDWVFTLMFLNCNIYVSSKAGVDVLKTNYSCSSTSSKSTPAYKHMKTFPLTSALNLIYHLRLTSLLLSSLHSISRCTVHRWKYTVDEKTLFIPQLYSLAHDNSIHLCIGSVFMKKVSQKRFNTLLCYISTEDDMPTITTQQAALCYIPKFSKPNVCNILNICMVYSITHSDK